MLVYHHHVSPQQRFVHLWPAEGAMTRNNNVWHTHLHTHTHHTHALSLSLSLSGLSLVSIQGQMEHGSDWLFWTEYLGSVRSGKAGFLLSCRDVRLIFWSDSAGCFHVQNSLHFSRFPDEFLSCCFRTISQRNRCCAVEILNWPSSLAKHEN